MKIYEYKMKLENITKDYTDDIKKLTQDTETMKYVGNGSVWDDEKIKNFIEYNDPLIKDKRNEKYFIIKDGKNFIGLIGISYLIILGNNYLNVIISPDFRGKGYYLKSLKVQ